MKIGFITDTNLLKQHKNDLYENKNFLNDTDLFLDYIESLEKTASKEELLYFMPNIVIEELYQQKVEAFQVRYNTLLEQYNKISYGLNGVLPKNNILEVLDSEKEQYLKKYKMISLEYTENIFKELVADALSKKAPFDKSEEGKKSDSGYKDALIWKTILYSTLINECDKLYLFSCDNIFEKNKQYLEEEFKKHHPATELIIKFFEPDGHQRQNSLQAIITENNLIETEIIQLYNLELILEEIRNIKFNYKDVVEYFINEEKKIVLKDIRFEEFTKEDFVIKEVKEDGEKYKVTLKFQTKKYDINEEYDLDKRTLLGKVILIFEKKNRKFKLVEYNIKNVEFFESYLTIFSNVMNNILTNTMKKTIETLANSIKITTEPFKKVQDTMSSMLINFNNNDIFRTLSDKTYDIELKDDDINNKTDRCSEDSEEEEIK